MAIKVGDRLPSATFMTMTAEGPKPQTTDEFFKGKKVALFAVPGAYTPHLLAAPPAELCETNAAPLR